jgi:hypothetical protein
MALAPVIRYALSRVNQIASVPAAPLRREDQRWNVTLWHERRTPRLILAEEKERSHAQR